MKIQDLLNKKVMLLDLQATTKEAAIDEMINSLVDNGVVTDFDVFKAGIMAREAQTSTGLGDGIAMPHSKNAAVKEATVLFAKSNKGVDYESLDGQPTDLFFMIAAPEETKKEQDITPPAEEEDSSVPSGQESLSATDIIGADIDEIAAQSKAKVDGINEKLNTIPPTIQGAVYVDEFQETFMEALEKARDTEEQAEQLLSV